MELRPEKEVTVLGSLTLMELQRKSMEARKSQTKASLQFLMPQVNLSDSSLDSNTFQDDKYVKAINGFGA